LYQALTNAYVPQGVTVTMSAPLPDKFWREQAHQPAFVIRGSFFDRAYHELKGTGL
jgi:hypothetical protein